MIMSMFDALWSEEKLKEKVQSMQQDLIDLDGKHRELQADLATQETKLKFGEVPHSERRRHMDAIQATMKQMEIILARKQRKQKRIKQINDRLQL